MIHDTIWWSSDSPLSLVVGRLVSIFGRTSMGYLYQGCILDGFLEKWAKLGQAKLGWQQMELGLVRFNCTACRP